MESFQKLRNDALEKLHVSEHLVDTTYSLVKEPKLLVSVIENIYLSLELTISALIEYEKKFISITGKLDTFEAKMDVFRRKIATKYDVEKDVIDFINEIKKTRDDHKKSNVEFTRKKAFVMSDNDYNITTLRIEDVKKTLSKAKHHVNELLKIIT